MSVNVNNVGNARKSRMWNEQDDAALGVLLKRKIRDTAVALRESESPYERARLKTQRERYKSMLHKVESGAYNGDIIFNELRASAALRQESVFSGNVYSSMSGGKEYTDSYGNMNFDYEAAFRKKRYYGAALPIFMTIFTILMIACFVLGVLSPTIINSETTTQIEDFSTVNVNALFVYRLGEYDGGMYDITIKADDNGYWWWPDGDYTGIKPTLGEPYTDANGTVHDGTDETVDLYEDLGCTEIYIDAADLIKAWFKTKMLSKTRLDFLEDQSLFQGQSYYYAIFLSGTKADDLVIKKGEDGNYDYGTIINHIGVYGTIINLVITVILMIIMLIQNIVRIFTYTSRRLHVTTLLAFIFSALTMISPALAICEGTDLDSAFKSYFSNLTNAAGFVTDTTATAGVTIMFVIPVAICLLLLILPKLFRNKYKSMPTHIPKGNKKIHA